MSERPNWAKKAWAWLTDGQWDRLSSRGVPTEHWRWEFGDRLQTAGCWVLCQGFGHKPVPDQCDKPEHDFCVYCMKPMPHLADRS